MMKPYNVIINTIFPPSCIACKATTRDVGTLCATCWNHINFITPPFCPKCSAPLEQYSDHDMVCGACMASPPPYNTARALMHYDKHSKPIITQLKYNDKTHFSKYIAEWLYPRFKSLIDPSDFIIPVPLHPKRLRMRRYNQSALIAKHLTEKTQNAQFAADALIRTKNAPPQTNLTYKQRIKNLHHSFECSKRDDIKNKVILLIDDVITTGTTVSQCSKTLLEAGAKEVNILALAKT